jgi:tRNA-modifying protein YgfZ
VKPSAAILGKVASTDTTTLSEQHATLTERCGLVDRSERGKLALTGGGAVEFLNGQVTNELAGLKSGEGCYAAFLTHKGKMLGDLRILAVGEETASSAASTTAVGSEEPSELLLDTERSALQALFDMIRRFKVGYEVGLHKRTLESALLSLAGPAAEEVAAKALLFGPSTSGSFVSAETPSYARARAGAQAMPQREHDHVLSHLSDTPVRLIRTDGGLDLLLDASAIEAARSALVEAGAVEVSEEAAEIVRVERGRPRYGIDLDDSTIPQEAGLNERAVSFTKGCYVGQETVARLYYRGKPNRHLRGLRLSEPVASGAELHLGERPVGHLGSSVRSPGFGAIGLALLRREAEPGATLAVGESGATAIVVELPFQ